MSLKRYLLFAGGGYYPQGGWNDFVADADTRGEIQTKLQDIQFDGDIGRNMFVFGHPIQGSEPWAMIIDSHERKVIAEYSWSIGYGDKKLGKWNTDAKKDA